VLLGGPKSEAWTEGPTGTSYLIGRLGLPSVKLIFSKQVLGKCKIVGEVKAIKSKK
jgi:hypothetical protein